jgi:hypothetical protein
VGRRDEPDKKSVCTSKTKLPAVLGRALDEEWQLDVVFGLLKAKVQNRLQREEIFSLDALLSRARAIEAILS